MASFGRRSLLRLAIAVLSISPAYAAESPSLAHPPAPRPAFWQGVPATQEGYLLAQLKLALYGSAWDRTRAHGAFCRVLDRDRVWVHTRYYTVSGATHDEILTSLRSSSTVIEEGDAVGSTQWSYHWQAAPELVGTGRGLLNASLMARITITMPRWKSAGDPALVSQWNSFSHALLYHEQGHQLIAEFTLAVLRLRLDQNAHSIAPMPISDVCDGVMRDYGDLDDRYDQITQHGALQGAVFNY